MPIRDIVDLIAATEPLLNEARSLGIFTNHRELASCSECGLHEDVDCHGVLFVTKGEENHKPVDLVFMEMDGQHVRCPLCGRIINCGHDSDEEPNSLMREHPDELCRVAVKLFMGIAREWRLTEEQCCKLAEINISELHCWQNSILEPHAIKLSKELLERLSLIAGIYKSIQLLFDDPNQWKEWVHKPNQHFDGRSALEEMLAGRLIEVRRYLDAWRQ